MRASLQAPLLLGHGHFVGGREGLVDDGDLRRVDRHLGGEAVAARFSALEAKPVEVAEVRVDAVDRVDFGRGVVTVSWDPPTEATGDASIEVQTQGERAELRASIGSVGERTHRSWIRGAGTPSFGLFGSGGVTSIGAANLGAIAEVSLPMKSTPFELLLEVGATRMFAAAELAPNGSLGRRERASANTLSAELGLRGTSSMSSSFDVHAALLAGIQQTWVSAFSSGTPATSRSDSQLGLRASAAAGASFRAGPGRFLLQVETSIVPFGTAGLEAPLGAVALQAGYVVMSR